MKLIYDGLITKHTMEYCLDCAREYGYVVEVSEFPNNMNELNKGSTYTMTGESCMGQSYSETRNGMGYVWVVKNFYDITSTEGFFFVKHKSDYDKVLQLCKDIVINPNPFKTSSE